MDTLQSRNQADELLSQYEPSLTVRQFLLKNLYRNDEGGFAWRLNLPVIEKNIEIIGNDLVNVRTVIEPTLFIRGAKSHYVRDSDIPHINEIFSNAQIDTIEAFVKSLVNFLQ